MEVVRGKISAAKRKLQSKGSCQLACCFICKILLVTLLKGDDHNYFTVLDKRHCLEKMCVNS